MKTRATKTFAVVRAQTQRVNDKFLLRRLTLFVSARTGDAGDEVAAFPEHEDTPPATSSQPARQQLAPRGSVSPRGSAAAEMPAQSHELAVGAYVSSAPARATRSASPDVTQRSGSSNRLMTPRSKAAAMKAHIDSLGHDHWLRKLEKARSWYRPQWRKRGI